MLGLLALSTSAGEYGVPAGSLTVATYGNSRGDIYLNSNYSGLGTKNIIMQPSSGSVGIGITTIAAKLHVAAGVNDGQLITSLDGTTFRGFLVNSNNNQFSVGTSSNHPLTFWANNSEQVRITADGRVGIGFTNPASSLHVYKSTSPDVYVKIEHTSTNPAYLLFTTSQGTAAIGMGNFSGTGFTNNLQLVCAGGIHLNPSGTGNVGIGISNPAYKLDVSGTVRLSSFGFGALSADSGGVLTSVKTLPIGIAAVTTSTALASGFNYIVGANSITLTLPAAPAQGDKIGFVPRPGVGSYTVGRNSLNIMGLAEDLVVDAQRPFALVYDNTTNGWLIAHA
jgi:hypothetical protein